MRSNIDAKNHFAQVCVRVCVCTYANIKHVYTIGDRHVPVCALSQTVRQTVPLLNQLVPSADANMSQFQTIPVPDAADVRELRDATCMKPFSFALQLITNVKGNVPVIPNRTSAVPFPLHSYLYLKVEERFHSSKKRACVCACVFSCMYLL